MENLDPEETYKHKINLYAGLSIIFIITGILFLFFAIKSYASTLYYQTDSTEIIEWKFTGSPPPIVANGITNWGKFTATGDQTITNGRAYVGGSGYNRPVSLVIQNLTGSYQCWSTSGTPNETGTDSNPILVDFVMKEGTPNYGEDCELTNGVDYWVYPSNTQNETQKTRGSDSATTTSVYYELSGDGTYGLNTNFNSRISWINPPKQSPSATTTSRTINFEFSYYLNSASSTDISKMILSLCPLSYPNDDCQKVDVGNVIEDSLETISTTTTTLRDGYYLGIVSFWNGVSESTTCSWWEFWCEAEQVKVYNSVSNNFNVATTTIEADIPISYEAISSQCEDGNFAEEGICKALLWLFYPSGSVLDGMEELGTTIRGKIPFGYFYQVSDKLNAISTASSTEGSNIIVHVWGDETTGTEITLMDWSQAKDFYSETFGNLDGYVVILAWLAFAGYAFYRISEII